MNCFLTRVVSLSFVVHASIVHAAQPLVTVEAKPLAQVANAGSPAIFQLDLQNHTEKSVLLGFVRGALSSKDRMGRGEYEYDIRITDEYGHQPELTALGTEASQHFVTSTYIVNIENNGSVSTVVDVGSLYFLKSGHKYVVRFLFKRDRAFLVSTDGQRLPFKIAALSNEVTVKID